MLISQYVALHYPQEGYCGNIALHLNPIPIVRQAVDDAASLCERNYGAAPSADISFTSCRIDQVHDVTYGVFPPAPACTHSNSTNVANSINPPSAATASASASDPSVLSVSYVPNHLHHIIFELTKNSMRAVVERYGAQHPDLPPIQVLLVSGADDFSVRISDRGGGFPLQHSPRLFSWLHTTASPRAQQALMRMQFNADARTRVDHSAGVGVQRILTEKMLHNTNGNPDEGLLDPNEPTPIAGFGYGLPLSRLFGRFFGGDVKVRSMPGHGVDAHVYLPKLDHNKTQL
jgi:signal transduction histidine kinase